MQLNCSLAQKREQQEDAHFDKHTCQRWQKEQNNKKESEKETLLIYLQNLTKQKQTISFHFNCYSHLSGAQFPRCNGYLCT